MYQVLKIKWDYVIFLLRTTRGAVQHTQNGNFNDNMVNKNDEFLH
jgi:hypothetical protein